MKFKLFAIKDTITGEYSMPIPMLNKQEFLRGATLMANSKHQNAVNTNIKDKQFWEIGEYDIKTAEITGMKNQNFIGHAIDVLETKEKKDEIKNEDKPK